jgi:hypothetical protein
MIASQRGVYADRAIVAINVVRAHAKIHDASQTALTRENLRALPAPLCLAQTLAAGLERSALLL